MTEQRPSNYLLACPFCGGTPRMATEYDPDGVKWHYITCPQCGARIRGQWHSPGNDCPLLRAEVRDQWNRRASDEPPAVDVAPIAKLTVRDGLVQRAGLYAPGLPDGDHDVFPVKGELRPHVLAEPPSGWRPIETAPKDGTLILTVVAGWQPGIFRWDEIGRWTPDPESFLNASDLGDWIDGNEYNPTHWMPLPAGPAVTKDAGECGACDKPGEHCANVHGICSRHGGRAHETSEGQPWKCTICNNQNPDDATHCRQCEYSRTVMRDGQRVPRDGRL